jgi:hypothetical protein
MVSNGNVLVVVSISCHNARAIHPTRRCDGFPAAVVQPDALGDATKEGVALLAGFGSFAVDKCKADLPGEQPIGLGVDAEGDHIAGIEVESGGGVERTKTIVDVAALPFEELGIEHTTRTLNIELESAIGRPIGIDGGWYQKNGARSANLHSLHQLSLPPLGG